MEAVEDRGEIFECTWLVVHQYDRLLLICRRDFFNIFDDGFLVDSSFGDADGGNNEPEN